MMSFTAYRQTAKTEEDVLVAFVRAVETQSQPPEEKAGIEGSVQWGVMRWRERLFDPEYGVTYGPAISARAVREGRDLVIRGSIRPSLAYWLEPLIGAGVFVAAFFLARAQGMRFGLPKEFSWLLIAAAAWFVVRVFIHLRGYRNRASAFAAKLLQEEPNHALQPTAAAGRG